MASPTSAHRPRLGFIGLGVMGHPMALHLAAAGYRVAAFDIDPAARQALASACAEIAIVAGPAAVGRASDIVLTMLPDGEQVSQVATGADGLATTLAPGSLLLDTSSSQPWLTLETAKVLAGRDIAVVDAPVSGARWGAEAAELVFMVGGSPGDVERVRPVLDVLGRAVFHLGPLGSGHVAKCINNMITAATFLATLEGLALGKHVGLDPALMNDVLNESTGGSWITRNHIGQRILSRTFDDPFKLELMVKDIRTAVDLAASNQLTLPLTSTCESSYRAAHDFAGAGESLSELARWVEHMTGVEIASTPPESTSHHHI